MSWNTFHFTLSPGQSTEPGYGWNNDSGAQMAIPREFTGSTLNNLLTADNFATLRDSNDNVWYYTTVTNNGGNVASFEFVGGGLS
jgi:hypothetical protein